jgi:mono/diheme cytochrome c family protein
MDRLVTWPRFCIAGIVMAATLAACNPAPPAEPTWDADVGPLLAAHCVRCHRSPPFADPAIQTPTRPRVPATRLDVYEVTAMESALIVGQVTRSDPAFRMPPPPSDRLTHYEIEVLTRWDRNGPPGMPRRQ